MGTQEFGEYLRTRREAQGLTIADVSDRTKIHMRHIRALEEGRLEALPGLVYAKAFVRHYARVVGEDPEALAAQFYQAVQLEGEAAALTTYRRRSRRRARRESRIPWPWMIVILLLGGVGFLIANAVDFGGEGSPPRAAPAGPASSQPQPRLSESPAGAEVAPGAAQGESVPAITGGFGAEAAPPDGASPAPEAILAGVPAAPAVDSLSFEPENVTGEGAGAGPAGPPVPPVSGALVTAASDGLIPAASDGPIPAAPDEPALPAAVRGVRLEASIERASWFSVEADGVLIFTGTLDAGQSAVWEADEELRVRYGRPEGVFITLNGEYLGRAGTGVITRVYTKDGVASN